MTSQDLQAPRRSGSGVRALLLYCIAPVLALMTGTMIHERLTRSVGHLLGGGMPPSLMLAAGLAMTAAGGLLALRL